MTTLPEPIDKRRRRARLFQKVLLLDVGLDTPMVQLLLSRITGALEDLQELQSLPPRTRRDQLDPRQAFREHGPVLERIDAAVRDIAMALTGKEWAPVKPRVISADKADWDIKL